MNLSLKRTTFILRARLRSCDFQLNALLHLGLDGVPRLFKTRFARFLLRYMPHQPVSLACSPHRHLRRVADSAPCRLAEHYSRRKQYRDALTLATAKAAALLQPPPTSNVLGVREESVLKAEKWALATRLRDLRVASEKTRENITAGESHRTPSRLRGPVR